MDKLSRHSLPQTGPQLGEKNNTIGDRGVCGAESGVQYRDSWHLGSIRISFEIAAVLYHDALAHPVDKFSDRICRRAPYSADSSEEGKAAEDGGE